MRSCSTHCEQTGHRRFAEHGGRHQSIAVDLFRRTGIDGVSVRLCADGICVLCPAAAWATVRTDGGRPPGMVDRGPPRQDDRRTGSVDDVFLALSICLGGGFRASSSFDSSRGGGSQAEPAGRRRAGDPRRPTDLRSRISRVRQKMVFLQGRTGSSPLGASAIRKDLGEGDPRITRLLEEGIRYGLDHHATRSIFVRPQARSRRPRQFVGMSRWTLIWRPRRQISASPPLAGGAVA